MLAFQQNLLVLTLLKSDYFVEKLTVCIGCIATIYLLCHADWWMGVVLINLLWQLVFSVNLPQSFITISLQNEKNLAFFFIFPPFSNFLMFFPFWTLHNMLMQRIDSFLAMQLIELELLSRNIWPKSIKCINHMQKYQKLIGGYFLK